MKMNNKCTYISIQRNALICLLQYYYTTYILRYLCKWILEFIHNYCILSRALICLRRFIWYLFSNAYYNNSTYIALTFTSNSTNWDNGKYKIIFTTTDCSASAVHTATIRCFHKKTFDKSINVFLRADCVW